MGLKRTVPPAVATQLVTIEEAGKQLSLPPGDGSHDSHLRRLLAAAVDVAERWTGRSLLTQTWRLAIDSFPREIVLPRPPLQSIASIQFVDANGTLTTLSASDYYAAADAEPARIAPAYGKTWPATRAEREAVRVTYVAGYGSAAADVPEPIRQAILLMVAQWFANREPTISGMNVSDVPLAAAFLLDAYKTGADVEWFQLAA
ncbi:MAG: hypothetical protein L0211_06915 [Planctomycetaceae bacterium]|nr:hypothetical protein [Planctomycetaceae bacterium]